MTGSKMPHSSSVLRLSVNMMKGIVRLIHIIKLLKIENIDIMLIDSSLDNTKIEKCCKCETFHTGN